MFQQTRGKFFEIQLTVKIQRKLLFQKSGSISVEKLNKQKFQVQIKGTESASLSETVCVSLNVNFGYADFFLLR